MKSKSFLLFSVVIVLLTTLVFAAPDVKKYDLKFKGDGYFDITIDGTDLVFSPVGGFDLLNVSHLGLQRSYGRFGWILRLTHFVVVHSQ